MAKKKQPAEEVETAVAVPDDGNLRGTKYARKSQPNQTNIAFRDFAQNLGAYFSHTDNSQDDSAVIQAFLAYNRPPWEMGGLTEYKDKEEVKLISRISVLSMEDWEDFPEWRENNPAYQMPVDQAYIYEVDKRSRSIGRAGLWELLEAITGIISPDLHKAAMKRKD